MPYIEWNDSFSANVQMIDSQHKKLFQIMNDLGAAMSSGKGKEAIEQTLASLFDYTKYHFDAEERHMRLHNYSDMEKHMKIHEEFIDKIMDLKKKLKIGGCALTVETMHFISSWLREHIMIKDKEFGLFLNSKGVE